MNSGVSANRKAVEILIKPLSGEEKKKSKHKRLKRVMLDKVSDTMVTADQRRRLPVFLLFR